MGALLDTYAQFPFNLERALGHTLVDPQGVEYVDFYGGHAVCLLGHSRKDLAEKLKEQAERLLFYSNVLAIEQRERVAAKLLQFADSDFQGVFFCNSGAEANENALKLALQKTGRRRLAAFAGGWHGRTLLAVSVTDDAKWHDSLGSWIGPVDRLPVNSIEALESITQEHAAVILEPIQSIGGVRCFERSFLEALRVRCDEVGAWLIFDEVQTGVGRLGVPYVAGHGLDGDSSVLPEISTSAKSLGNGVPVGAMLVNQKVAETIELGDLGSTFGGGPLALAAVEFVVDALQEGSLVQRARYIGDTLTKELSDLPAIVEVRGRGALLGIEFDREAKLIQRMLLERKIVTGTSGHSATLRIMPPIILDDAALDRFIDAVRMVTR